MRAKAIMVLGTSSHVGKSLLTTALCRIFHRHGYRVAPFKSQNMSLNSAVTADGLEIGRAQALQAEAAGVSPCVEMNPILIKPMGDMSSQIVVRGKIWAHVTASDYHKHRVEQLLPLVKECYETLAAEYDIIVLEGAGSPAEINLKQHDIVNMRMAAMADAACILVGDIDRGGVFASLLGTMELLEPAERARIRAFTINKFRGDLSLLEPGITSMEQRIAKPCLGVIPYLHGLALEEEDSLGLPTLDPTPWPPDSSSNRPLRLAIVALPTLSNFTDFDALQAEPAIALRFTRSPDLLRSADVIILPGSKQTASDLACLRAEGLDQVILEHAKTKPILGLCGGLQMLGHTITDSAGTEHMGSVQGLGLLDLSTTMQPAKLTRLSAGVTVNDHLFGQPMGPIPVRGYEIHIGETTSQVRPFANVTRTGDSRPTADGCVSVDGRIVGTYLHGIFDDDSFRHAFLRAARAFHALSPATTLTPWGGPRQASINRLADTVEQAWDMPLVFSWAGVDYRGPA
jgi:adenosylcobyric acid synthase